MKFTNLTRRTEIGANCYLLETDAEKFVLDSGMHPAEEGEAALPLLELIGTRDLDAIIISHAHQDHIGTLPVLMRRHPDARVFMTEATAAIGDDLLHNSVNVMTRQREELGTTLYPLFTHKETNRATDLWRSCRFRQATNLAGDRVKQHGGARVTFEFFDAGHVLGSAGVLFHAEGRRFFYSGDVNFEAQTIAQPAVFPESGIDVLIIETTRGDTATPEGFTRAGEEKRFAEAIERAFTRGGCVLVPVFALGKTQEVLAMIYKFRREKWLGEFPVYIGGLSTKMTATYDRFSLTSRRNFPAPAAAGRGRAVHLEWPDHCGCAGQARPHLRAFQRHDDGENALEYFRAACARRPEAFHFLCWLRRSGIARRHSARGENGRCDYAG